MTDLKNHLRTWLSTSSFQGSVWEPTRLKSGMKISKTRSRTWLSTGSCQGPVWEPYTPKKWYEIQTAAWCRYSKDPLCECGRHGGLFASTGSLHAQKWFEIHFMNAANPRDFWPEWETHTAKKKVRQETNSSLSAKVSVLTDLCFCAPLSFACLSLTALGAFVYQAIYILMKFAVLYKIKSSHRSTKHTLISLFRFVSQFILFQAKSIFVCWFFHSQFILLRAINIFICWFFRSQFIFL